MFVPVFIGPQLIMNMETLMDYENWDQVRQRTEEHQQWLLLVQEKHECLGILMAMKICYTLPHPKYPYIFAEDLAVLESFFPTP